MLTDVVMTLLVVFVLSGVTALLAPRFPLSMRKWLWFALGEYLFCGVAQLVYSRVIVQGGDTLLYARTGTEFAKILDAHFGWAWPELIALLLQRPSAFDEVVFGGGGTNTASMSAVCGWLIFFFRGSEYAAHFCVTGMAFLGALCIFKACWDASPKASPMPLFVATVLFPSIAFWTAALHKEAFGLAGIGALLTAWRGVYRARWFRVIAFGPLGFMVVLLFRAPVLAPLLLGLVIFFAAERVQKIRGIQATLLAPVYFGLALVVLALGMIALTRLAPTLALDRLGETVASRQQSWAMSRGGSSFDVDDAGPQTLGGQLARVPLALLNALFRPQLFDVNNFGALLSAIEMTAITWMILRSVFRLGLRGVITKIQSSPFLLMCLAITIVGSAFVGLVTLNFGSLARYRVPFLPFYGVLVLALNQSAKQTARIGAPASRGLRARMAKPPAPKHVRVGGRGIGASIRPKHVK